MSKIKFVSTEVRHITSFYKITGQQGNNEKNNYQTELQSYRQLILYTSNQI